MNYLSDLKATRDETRARIDKMEKQWISLASSNNKDEAETASLERQLQWAYKEVGYIPKNRSVAANPRAPEVAVEGCVSFNQIVDPSLFQVWIFIGQDKRRGEADALKMGIEKAGFRVEQISTSFEEAPPLTEPGSTFIAPTLRGDAVKCNIARVAVQANLPKIHVGNASPLKRGDVQVFLY